LIEPLGEKKNSENASEVGARRASRSKDERIINKMTRSGSVGLRNTKRGLLGSVEARGNRSIVKLYSCFLARARGS
jgi:hypothetical protein